jgi:SAM-dependent methyltransferase
VPKKKEPRLRRVYTKLCDGYMRRSRHGKLRLLKGSALSPLYWGAAHFYRVPGLYLHRRIALFGLRLLFSARRSVSYHTVYLLAFHPMDSVRYFEFDFMWRALATSLPLGRCLDVSSPRMFPLMLLRKERKLRADLLNPDGRDLSFTESLFRAGGVAERCRFHCCTIQEAPFEPGSFNTITSMSVLEHIPEDRAALERIWDLLKPGGRLLLSVPCSAEAFEEFTDLDEYGLLEKNDEGFVFGQRFYDSELLEKRVFAVTGKPARHALYGEKKAGVFFEDRRAKVHNDNPFWREPYMLGRQYRYYSSVDDLPGLGVIAMEFVKE